MSGEGARGCYKCSQNVVYMNVSGWWLDVEEKTAASNDSSGCNFKPFRAHTFINFLLQKKF